MGLLSSLLTYSNFSYKKYTTSNSIAAKTVSSPVRRAKLPDLKFFGVFDTARVDEHPWRNRNGVLSSLPATPVLKYWTGPCSSHSSPLNFNSLTHFLGGFTLGEGPVVLRDDIFLWHLVAWYSIKACHLAAKGRNDRAMTLITSTSGRTPHHVLRALGWA